MKRRPQLSLPSGLIVDNFAGGGGASTGIELALGRSPDIAVNHDPEAIAMHEANHPATRHLCGDVWDVDPAKVCGGRPVALAWFSPNCTHFSRAKGGKPLDAKNRALAWVVVRWARTVKPRVIALENVMEFADWGPLLPDRLPNPERRSWTFRRWVGSLEAAGYRVEWRQLRMCDYGAPTTRKRLFLVARCDGQPIMWPEPTHGPGRLPFLTAADCIDWSLPCRSIFGRRRPLAEKTLRRIARGLRRFAIACARPFIVPGPVAPVLIQTGYGERDGQAPRSLDLHAPLGSVVAGGQKHALVQAFLAKHYGGHEGAGSALSRPVDTITAQDHHALVTAHLSKLYGTSTGSDLGEPMPTVTANGRGGGHLAEVRAFLLRYYGESKEGDLRSPLGTVTTRDRFGLVYVAGEAYEIADIAMRMLSARELFRAQGFDDAYVIDPIYEGKPLTQTAQIRMVGNSVSPPVAAAIVRANVAREEVAVA